MKTTQFSVILAIAALLALASQQADAALTLTSGLGTTHTNNIVVNGSFENATFPTPAPPNGSSYYWADTSNSPYAVPDGWTSNNNSNTARWGNDGAWPYRLSASDVLPDGRLGVGFHTATGVLVNQPPTFNPNGSVTFPATPTFSNPPVVIRQLGVPTNLFPQPSYNMSFWISGEEISTNQGFTGLGIIGFRMTNVLPGDPIQFLTVPNGLSFGSSHLYEYTFTPLNPLLPVDIQFMNWGSLNLTTYGGSAFGVQPILDDVIINAVPEPSSIVLIGCGAVALMCCWRRRVSKYA